MLHACLQHGVRHQAFVQIWLLHVIVATTHCLSNSPLGVLLPAVRKWVLTERLVAGRACWTSLRHGPRVLGALASPSATLVSAILHHNLHLCQCVVCRERADQPIVADCVLLPFGPAVHNPLDSDNIHQLKSTFI